MINSAEIRLGNGSDTLSYELTGAQFRHRIVIDTETGDDSVSLLASGVVGSVRIDTGVESDNVAIDLAAGSFLLHGLRVNTGVGDDSVLFHADSDGGLPLLSGFSLIETAEGNDTVQFEGVFGALGSGLVVDLGAGDDMVIGDSETSLPEGRVECIGHAGHDTVLNASYFRSPFVLHLFETIED